MNSPESELIEIEINGKKEKLVKIRGEVGIIEKKGTKSSENLKITLQRKRDGKVLEERLLNFKKGDRYSGREIILPGDRIKAGVLLGSEKPKEEEPLNTLYILKLKGREIYYRKDFRPSWLHFNTIRFYD